MNSGLPTAGLRDLHLPVEPGWWPPAIGWWLLAFVVLGATIWLGRQLYRYRAKRLWKAIAMVEIERIGKLPVDTDSQRREQLQACSRLARRVALAVAPRSNVASLVGEAWLEYLDSLSNTIDFTQGPGRLLAVGPYAPEAPEHKELESVLLLIERTVQQSRLGCRDA